MDIQIKRIYEDSKKSDGLRILVDRLWPRGVSKEKAHLDLWLKEIAPSTQLRTAFCHKVENWLEFQDKYYFFSFSFSTIIVGEQISIKAKVEADSKPTYIACSFRTPHVGIILVAMLVTKNMIKYFIRFFSLNIYYELDNKFGFV